MAICPSCQSTDVEQSEAQIVCKVCGTVLEDSQIVSDVTFAENSAGGAVVQGSYVGNEQRGARTQGPGGFRSGGIGASREQTVSNARYAIRALGSAKRVPPATIEKAGRLFQLALEGGTYKADGTEPHNFVLGRKSEYTQASCLYVACRMDRTNHMLIDFADAIGVNVFVLGRSYLRLIRCLGFVMPIIDPSIYISRFASLLDFGDETQRVATDATRLVKRFNKDWITHGRRPAGICGACLLLAARMNNFRRSIAEIIQVVKIADVTLRKRLEEFKETSSSKLTIDDFRNIWLEEESEPPAFALQGLTKKGKKKGSKGRPNKKLKGEDEEEEEEGGNEADVEEEDEEGEEEQQQPSVDPRLEALADQATHAEISQYLDEDAARELQKKEGEAAQIKSSQKELPALDDELAGLDEEELEAFILTPDEVKIKERVWVEFNRDYLEKTLERQLKMEADIKAGINPKPTRRKRSKPRDSSAAPSTAAESTKQMLRKKKFSRRLNYDKISSLFDQVPTPNKTKRSHSDVEDEEEVEDAIYHGLMKEGRPRGDSLYNSEAETTDGELIIEEQGDALPNNHPDVRKRSKRDLQMRDKRKRGANSIGHGGEESEADGATSHGGITDGDDDNEDWMAGIPGYRRDSEAVAEDDLYEQEYE